MAGKNLRTSQESQLLHSQDSEVASASVDVEQTSQSEEETEEPQRGHSRVAEGSRASTSPIGNGNKRRWSPPQTENCELLHGLQTSSTQAATREDECPIRPKQSRTDEEQLCTWVSDDPAEDTIVAEETAAKEAETPKRRSIPLNFFNDRLSKMLQQFEQEDAASHSAIAEELLRRPDPACIDERRSPSPSAVDEVCPDGSPESENETDNSNSSEADSEELVLNNVTIRRHSPARVSNKEEANEEQQPAAETVAAAAPRPQPVIQQAEDPTDRALAKLDEELRQEPRRNGRRVPVPLAQGGLAVDTSLRTYPDATSFDLAYHNNMLYRGFVENHPDDLRRLCMIKAQIIRTEEEIIRRRVELPLPDITRRRKRLSDTPIDELLEHNEAIIAGMPRTPAKHPRVNPINEPEALNPCEELNQRIATESSSDDSSDLDISESALSTPVLGELSMNIPLNIIDEERGNFSGDPSGISLYDLANEEKPGFGNDVENKKRKAPSKDEVGQHPRDA